MLDSCRALESEGFDVTYLPVMENGLINLQVRQKIQKSRFFLVT